MRTDDDVTIAFANLSDVIAKRSIPAVAVMSSLDISPQMIQWDPARYSFSAERPTELAESGLPILYFEGDAYMEFLVGSGLHRRGPTRSVVHRVTGPMDPGRW